MLQIAWQAWDKNVNTSTTWFVDLCNRLKVSYILRGLRTSADFEFERAIAQVNKAMFPQIETVFLLTAPEHTPVNSTIIRDILLHKGDPSQFIPSSLHIYDYIDTK